MSDKIIYILYGIGYIEEFYEVKYVDSLFFDKQKALDAVSQYKARWQCRNKIRIEANRLQTVFFPEEPIRPNIPLKPKKRIDQTEKQHIEENLNPWREAMKNILEPYEKALTAWYEKRDAFIESQINTGYAKEIDDFKFTMEEMLELPDDLEDMPKWTVEEMEVI